MAKMFELRNQLLDSFSEAELDDLCFELNITYSDLPGVNRPAKARELVAFCYRNNTLPNLLALCTEKRGHINWQRFAMLEPVTPVDVDVATPPPATISPQQIRLFLNVLGIPANHSRNKYADTQVDVYDGIWKALYDLKSAGDDLWQTVSRENIFKFSQLWEAAEQHVEKNAIFLEEEDYQELKRLLGMFADYRVGKIHLHNIHRREDLDFVDDAMAHHQIQQNQAHKAEYEAVLDRIKASFRKRLAHT